MHALILGARAPACLEWARAFKAAGWQVSTGDSLHWPVSRFCKAADHYLHLPEPRKNPTAWIAALQTAVQKHHIDLVLPTCEEAFYLAHGRDQIPCKVLTASFDLMHHLHHKGRFATMIKGWPLQAPETRLLETPTELDLFEDPCNWVFKPAYSRFARQTLLQPTRRQLAAIQPTRAQPWVAQRFITGKEHCSFSVLVDGKLKAHAVYHPRYRVGRGSGIWFDPVEAPAIQSFVEYFGVQTCYTGQVSFDYIRDIDGHDHVLECNPRATSGVHLFDDQPTSLIAALNGTGPLITPTMAPRQVGLAMLLFASPRHGLDRQFWHDWRRARDVILRPGDVKPLAAQWLALAEIAYRAVTQRSGLLAAATADIEWDGQPMGNTP